jgi:putative ABC transport system permease protein
VAVISQLTSLLLFGQTEAVGAEISLQLSDQAGYEQLFTVVGVYQTPQDQLRDAANRDWLANPVISDQVYIPETVILLSGYFETSYRQTILQAASAEEAEQIRAFLSANSEIAIHTFVDSARTLQQAHQGNSRLLNIGLVAVLILTGVSLLNSLMFSVRDRTVEIGLKKAVGAKAVDICIQFFGEGVLIGVGGFVAGLAVSIPGALVLQQLLHSTGFSSGQFFVFIDPAIIGRCFFMVLLQAVIFSLIPALYAASIKVADAIRFD